MLSNNQKLVAAEHSKPIAENLRKLVIALNAIANDPLLTAARTASNLALKDVLASGRAVDLSAALAALPRLDSIEQHLRKLADNEELYVKLCAGAKLAGEIRQAIGVMVEKVNAHNPDVVPGPVVEQAEGSPTPAERGDGTPSPETPPEPPAGG